MSTEINVFYVTAGHVRTPEARTDLGKFFSEDDASKFAVSLAGGWVQRRIEKRIERLEDQHEAHRKIR